MGRRILGPNGEQMRRIRFTYGVLVAVSALIGSVAAGAQPPPLARVSLPVRTGTEYVVAFQGSAAEAIGAIGNAGGIVLDVNETIGVALVSSVYSAFLADVRAAGVVTGVARNHAIATIRPGMPHRFAEERPEVTGPPVANRQAVATLATVQAVKPKKEEPLNGLQWDMQMIGANANGAHRKATGRGVLVGVIDTGV